MQFIDRQSLELKSKWKQRNYFRPFLFQRRQKHTERLLRHFVPRNDREIASLPDLSLCRAKQSHSKSGNRIAALPPIARNAHRGELSLENCPSVIASRAKQSHVLLNIKKPLCCGIVHENLRELHTLGLWTHSELCV